MSSLYGLADARLAGAELGELVEIFVRRGDAERALADVLTNEPARAGDFSVVEIPSSFYTPN